MAAGTVGEFFHFPARIVLQVVKARTCVFYQPGSDAVEDNRVVVPGQAEIAGGLGDVAALEMAGDGTALDIPSNTCAARLVVLARVHPIHTAAVVGQPHCGRGASRGRRHRDRIAGGGRTSGKGHLVIAHIGQGCKAVVPLLAAAAGRQHVDVAGGRQWFVIAIRSVAPAAAHQGQEEGIALLLRHGALAHQAIFHLVQLHQCHGQPLVGPVIDTGQGFPTAAIQHLLLALGTGRHIVGLFRCHCAPGTVGDPIEHQTVGKAAPIGQSEAAGVQTEFQGLPRLGKGLSCAVPVQAGKGELKGHLHGRELLGYITVQHIDAGLHRLGQTAGRAFQGQGQFPDGHLPSFRGQGQRHRTGRQTQWQFFVCIGRSGHFLNRNGLHRRQNQRLYFLGQFKRGGIGGMSEGKSLRPLRRG